MEKEQENERELVLCFDGTGNTFRADGGESNILKIFRLLDRTKENRYCYYQRMPPSLIPIQLQIKMLTSEKPASAPKSPPAASQTLPSVQPRNSTLRKPSTSHLQPPSTNTSSADTASSRGDGNQARKSTYSASHGARIQRVS